MHKLSSEDIVQGVQAIRDFTNLYVLNIEQTQKK